MNHNPSPPTHTHTPTPTLYLVNRLEFFSNSENSLNVVIAELLNQMGYRRIVLRMNQCCKSKQ